MSKNPPKRPQAPQEQWVRTDTKGEFMTFLEKDGKIKAGAKTRILDDSDNNGRAEDDTIRNILVQILNVLHSETGLHGFLNKKASKTTFEDPSAGKRDAEFPTWTFETRFDGETHRALFGNFAKLAQTGLNSRECVLVRFKVVQAEQQEDTSPYREPTKAQGKKKRRS